MADTREVCYVTDSNGRPALVYVTPEQFDVSVKSCGGAVACHMCLVNGCKPRSTMWAPTKKV